MADFEPIGLVLCGLGRMGSIHLKNIASNKRVKLQYIIEIDLEKAHQMVKHYKLRNTECVHFDNAQKAINCKSVSGVVICTPTDLHQPLVLMALSAGKHILCEKPLATNLVGVMECYKLAKEKSLRLLVAFNRRYDPQFNELHMRKSEAGTLQSVKVCSRDSPKPSLDYLKISGGIFHDCIVHDMDILRWMTGEDPETVYTTAHCHDPNIRALDDHDTVFVVLKFPSGVLAHIDISRDCKHGYDQTIQLYGSNGNLISDNQRKTSITVNGGKTRDDIYYSFPERYAEAYEIELDHFVDLVEDPKTEARIKARDTIMATFLSQAAEDSCREKRVINIQDHFSRIFGSSQDAVFSKF